MVLSLLINLILSATIASAQNFASPWSYSQSSPSVQVTVNTNNQHQTMLGGGCSGAFGVACDQTGGAGLSDTNQQLVSDILFSENIGGLSILRNRIGSSATDGILGSCPDTPSSSFNYTFSSNNATADSCQLKLTQQALISNPNLSIYANAWSANHCFKTDASDINGGFICGVRGTNCTQDWRQGYADYLVQYVKFYAERGITINMLGAWNEPDFNPITYASMQSDGYQAKDFLEVLYPTVKKYRQDLLVTCCDATGARQQRNVFSELNDAGGGKMFDVASWHNYQSNPERPFNVQNGQPNIMTEWSDGSSKWNTTWDVTGQLAEGLQWAMYMHNAIVNSNTAGYLHWWCSQNNAGDAVLVRLAANTFQVSSRLWAFAGFFRFARPGSVRVDATSSAENLYVSAFVNKNGTVAIPVINAAHFERSVDISLTGRNVRATKATAYLADNTHNNTAAVASYSLKGKVLMASVPPRSMTTFFLE